MSRRSARRHRSLAFMLTLGLASGGIALAATAALAVPVTSTGPLTRVENNEYLNCAVSYAGDVHPEFYGDTACATMLAVEGTLFGPPNIPAGNSASPRTGFTPVSQSAVLGTGTSGDPYRTVTVVDLGASFLRGKSATIKGRHLEDDPPS